MLLGEVERVLSEHGVARRGSDVVLVACSGGGDSVVLAHAASELLGARRVILGHVDHAVRESSADDARFVENYARALNVESKTVRLEPGSPSEDRLRELRYEALEKMRDACGAKYVLTAHTEDDQAETVLLALIRWAEPRRLGGMAVRRGAVLRPMLGVPKSEVRAYAAAKKLVWSEDPTNREPAYLRNRVRKELLPLLERRYRSGIARRLAKMAVAVRGTTAEVPGAIRFERRAGCDGGFPNDGSIAAFDADVLVTPTIREISSDARGRRLVVTREDGAVVWEPGSPPTGDAPVGPLTRNVWVFWMERSAQLRGGHRSVTLDEVRSKGLEQEDE